MSEQANRRGARSHVLGRFLGTIWSSILRLTSAAAQQSPAFNASDQLLMNFYMDPRPERLIGFLDEHQKMRVAENWTTYAFLAGFFAVIFRKHPDRVERLIPASINPQMADTLAAALWLSGNHTMGKKLQPRFDRAGSDATLNAQLAGLPSRLESVQVQNPAHLDLMWGAAFASGDGTFVLVITDYFSRTISEPTTMDVLAMTQAITIQSKSKKKLFDGMRKKYGDEQSILIAIAATALWALNTSARKHQFVEQTIAKYIDDHSNSPAAKALVATRPKPKRP